MDIDTSKLAFIGYGRGGWFGPIVSAREPRLKVNVLIAGGLPGGRPMASNDPFNFAPRVTAPTLLVNGRYDFVFPVESSQVPLFDSLGTSPEHKRHVLLDFGHIVTVSQTSTEILSWLDRYFGSVQQGATGRRKRRLSATCHLQSKRERDQVIEGNCRVRRSRRPEPFPHRCP